MRLDDRRLSSGPSAVFKDLVQTRADAFTSVLFADGSRVDIDQESELKVASRRRNSEIGVARGSLRTSFRTPAEPSAAPNT